MTAAPQISQHDEIGHSKHEEQDGDQVMPFYILVDKSTSMQDIEAELNAALADLQQMIQDNPQVADVVRISILAFDHEASVVVPLGSFEEQPLPYIKASGGTNYSNAFKALRAAIDADIPKLKAQGFEVYRPCAFFMTDGEPNMEDTDWERQFAVEFHYDAETKTGNKQHPRFIPIGFRDASLATLSKLAYPAQGGQAFVQSQGSSVTDALNAVIPFIGKTILRTGQTAPTGLRHDLPTQAEGLASAPSQYAGGDWM